MEIYLVRHGETGGNVAHRHQADETPLSIAGRRQAEEAARLLREYEPTHLVSSSLVRAVETAAVIGETCDLVPETSPTFIELARPSHLYGHYHRSPRSLWFYLQWYMGSEAALRSEGESYRTLRERIKQAKYELSQYPEDARVVVVSHSVFMSFFVEHLCREKPISPLMAVRAFHRILSMQNTHIMQLVFDPRTDADVCAWSVD